MHLTRFQPNQSHPNFPHLDDSLYPLHWQNSVFDDAYSVIYELLQLYTNNTASVDDDVTAQVLIKQRQFSDLLLDDATYQAWINFSLFGRYIQRSFMAFYDTQQGLDDTSNLFTAEMPAILHQELIRHARYLPVGQTLFVANPLPKHTRNDKVLLATVNPVTAVLQALTGAAKPKRANASQFIQSSHLPQQRFTVVNHIRITSNKVLAFAVKHNKRTRERYLNQVMVVDFAQLTLVKEIEIKQLVKVATQTIASNKTKHSENSNCANRNQQGIDEDAIVLREYELS